MGFPSFSPLFAPEAPPASGKFFFFAVIQMHAPPGQAKGRLTFGTGKLLILWKFGRPVFTSPNPVLQCTNGTSGFRFESL
jgi:hypothetical protein